MDARGSGSRSSKSSASSPESIDALALPLPLYGVFGVRVAWPSPGPRVNVSLALFHLHASRGIYRCVRR